MADLTIKLTFSDDNGAKDGSTSPSDNDGYAIYRREGADPGNDSNYRIYTNNNPTPGVGTITYEDSGVSVDKIYFYRIENIRGSETALGPLIGPINAPSLTGLGYPNNTPSHTDGVTNYISTEPLIHYDAWKEMASYGEDYKYGYGDYIKNQANTYNNLNMLFFNGGVHMGLDGVTPELRPHNDTATTGSFPRIDATAYANWCAQIKAARGIDSDFQGRLILDKGATFVLIHPSRSSHLRDGVNDSRTFSDASQHQSGNWMQARIPGRFLKSLTRNKTPWKDHRSVQFSDGSDWTDPDPFMGSADPNDPAWYPDENFKNYDTYYNFGFHNLGGASAGMSPYCVANSGNVAIRDWYQEEHLVDVLTDTGSGVVIKHSEWPQLSTSTGQINVYIKRIHPDGTYEFYINGVLADTNSGANKALIADMDGTKHPWGTSSLDYWYQKMQSTIPLMSLLFPPQIGLNSTKNTNPNVNYGFSDTSYIYPVPLSPASATGHFFNELMLIPSDLTDTSGDFTRLVNYINSKYQGSDKFATQGNYE